MADLITDPQSQSPYPQADVTHVDDTPVGGQEDNQRILPRQTPSGVSRGVQQLGGPSLEADSGNKRITVTDAVPQVLMGNQPTFGEGFYVTKPGIDVTSTTNAADFVFNSNQNVFKIVDTGVATMPVASFSMTSKTIGFGSAELAIPHGLSYAPIVIGFITGFVGEATSFPLPFTNYSAGTGIRIVHENFAIGSDETNIYLDSFIEWIAEAAETVNGATPSNIVVKYYLLQETAN